MKRTVLLCLVASALGALPGLAQQNPGEAGKGQSLPDALEAIQRARVTTRILLITAHPDDESSSLLAYLAHGMGADITLLTLTRGEGGQNAIGPELGPQLAAIRGEELYAATQVEGARLFFTRAPDFGYSKTVEETQKMWKDTALADMVRVIRTFRPHIIINGWGGVRAGHGHHQTSGLLTPQAFAAAGDSGAFPDQFADGVGPWKPTLLLEPSRGNSTAGWRVPTDEVSPVLGKSYTEIGLEGFVHHRSQGVSAFLASPFLSRVIRLARADGGTFDPAQLAEPLTGLKTGSLPSPSNELADRALAQAAAAAQALNWAECARHLAEAGKIAAQWENALPARDRNPETLWELNRVREKIDAALAIATGLRVEAQADHSEIVAGESFIVRVKARRRSEVAGEFSKPSLVLPAGWSVTKEESDPSGATRLTTSILKDADVPRVPNDWMLPVPPPLVQARVHAVLDGYGFDVTAPVTALHVTSTRVDTVRVTLVPAYTLALEPRQFILAEKRPLKPLEVVARVHSYSGAAAKVTVGLDMPGGWQVSSAATLEFTGPGDQLVRFVVTPPARIPQGHYELKAYVRRGVEEFRTTLEPLPSLPTRLWSEPAVATVRAFDIAVPENLRVGYVAAENDPIPDELRRLGIRVELLDPPALAFANLQRFDAMAIGIRAYELREDLARANRRLLDYAAAGGTLVVQYERGNVWDTLKPAPYTATIGPAALRITDENSPVRFLAPDDPLLNFPNKITSADFQGWVQDRGLYFWNEWDARYKPLLSMRDPGEEEVHGGLVYAHTGKGIYIYTGLAFYRQLPEGVPGAFRLFVNLLSQSKAH